MAALVEAAVRIVRVLRVVDTREWIQLEDDRWVAVAGSGDVRKCDRCSRDHEVQAHVELSNGAEAVVGTGCARGESAEMVQALAQGAGRAKRFARLTAELAAARASLAAWDAAWTAIEKVPAPELVDSTKVRRLGAAVSDAGGDSIPVLVCGDQHYWHRTVRSLSRLDREDIERCWRLAQIEKAGLPHYRPAQKVAALELKLGRLATK
jgi:hypothetical protein